MGYVKKIKVNGEWVPVVGVTSTEPYPPHSAVVVSTQDKALMDALAKFTKTSSCPLYLKTAYQNAKAQ